MERLKKSKMSVTERFGVATAESERSGARFEPAFGDDAVASAAQSTTTENPEAKPAPDVALAGRRGDRPRRCRPPPEFTAPALGGEEGACVTRGNRLSDGGRAPGVLA